MARFYFYFSFLLCVCVCLSANVAVAQGGPDGMDSRSRKSSVSEKRSDKNKTSSKKAVPNPRGTRRRTRPGSVTTIQRESVKVDNPVTTNREIEPVLPSTESKIITAENYIQLAKADFDRKNYDSAIANYTLAIEIAPQSYEAYYRRAKTYDRMKKPDLALSDLTTALGIRKTSDAYVSRGNIYLYSKSQFILAKPDYDMAIQIDPSESSFAIRAEAFLESNRVKNRDLAEADFIKSSAMNSGKVKLSFDQLNAFKSRSSIGCHHRNDETEALNLSVHFLLQRGMGCLAEGKNGLALKDFNAAVQMDPNLYWSFIARGYFYMAYKESHNVAIEDFNKAIENLPGFYTGYQFRAQSYRWARKYELSIADSNKAIELFPYSNPDELYAFRGMTYMDFGRYDLAIADLTKAIEIDPKDSKYLHSRAKLFKEINKNDLAKEDLRKAKELDN